MTKDQRTACLDEAPVGTRITGLYAKNDGHELKVEKKEGYIPGLLSNQSTIYWAIDGEKQTVLSMHLRKAADGSSKYYTTKKPKR
ncbi:MAG: hypothetical protein MSH24_06395 [Lachnospiraceae bacterium]|nr:hypothetical protein [Lachnospiraceae bacterium]